MPRVTAIEPHDGHAPGTDYEVGEKAARQLEAKGLVKMWGPAHNKMAPDHLNKGADHRDPTEAAGGVRTSSASPADQASTETTSTSSGDGATANQSTTPVVTNTPSDKIPDETVAKVVQDAAKEHTAAAKKTTARKAPPAE